MEQGHGRRLHRHLFPRRLHLDSAHVSRPHVVAFLQRLRLGSAGQSHLWLLQHLVPARGRHARLRVRHSHWRRCSAHLPQRYPCRLLHLCRNGRRLALGQISQQDAEEETKTLLCPFFQAANGSKAVRLPAGSIGVHPELHSSSRDAGARRRGGGTAATGCRGLARFKFKIVQSRLHPRARGANALFQLDPAPLPQSSCSQHSQDFRGRDLDRSGAAASFTHSRAGRRP